MPRGVGRPLNADERRRNAALHEGLKGLAVDRELRAQNVRTMQVAQQTREVMAETGASRRKGRIRRSMLSD
jgi:hypothetical protein